MGDWHQAVDEDIERAAGRGRYYRHETKTLGRTLDVTWEISAYEPSRVMEQRMDSGAMRGLIRFTLEEAGRGTRVTLVSEGETGGLLKLADPIVARTLKKQFAADLETLKTLLENQPATTGAAS